MIFNENEKIIIAGISVRTTNENGQSAIDIPALWNKFMTGSYGKIIANKTDDTIYCLYTDYEKDHTRPYTTILGYRVSNADNLPADVTVKEFVAGKYQVFTAKGKIADGIVYNEWLTIWNSAINRIFTTDIEVYGAKAQDPNNAEIPILVAVK